MDSGFPLGHCPVCDSNFFVYLRHLYAPRSQKDIPLYFCMDCCSFVTPSGYKEDDEQLRAAADWHMSVEDRNAKWAHNFLSAVRYCYPHVESIIQIGCGTGILLKVAQSEFNMRVIGYDTNLHAINLGRAAHKGISLIHDCWTSRSLEEKYDLVVSISFMQQLEQPRIHMGEIADYCKRHQSAAFISVPYYEREKWDLLLKPNPGDDQRSDFRFVDVRVIHFSKCGLATMANQFGATSTIFFLRGWQGHWIEF